MTMINEYIKSTSDKMIDVYIELLNIIFETGIILDIADVVEWSRALVIRRSDWCCSVLMVGVQILSREEQKFDSSKI
jgi:hypothetical protein